MSTPYLDLAAFKARTLMASGEVDYVAQDSPGFVESRIAIRTSYIHGRLRKRYGNNGAQSTLPFSAPVPEIVLGWLTSMVTLDVLRKRGINPQDPQAAMYAADAETALAELKEASDSKDGLFDLPSSNVDGSDSAVTTGGPLGYSETSPYVWTIVERNNGRAQDAQYLRGAGEGGF